MTRFGAKWGLRCAVERGDQDCQLVQTHNGRRGKVWYDSVNGTVENGPPLAIGID